MVRKAYCRGRALLVCLFPPRPTNTVLNTHTSSGAGRRLKELLPAGKAALAIV